MIINDLKDRKEKDDPVGQGGRLYLILNND